jgi:hypothetical protein
VVRFSGGLYGVLVFDRGWPMSETNAPNAPAGLAHPTASRIDARLDLAAGDPAANEVRVVARAGCGILLADERAPGGAEGRVVRS